MCCVCPRGPLLTPDPQKWSQQRCKEVAWSDTLESELTEPPAECTAPSPLPAPLRGAAAGSPCSLEPKRSCASPRCANLLRSLARSPHVVPASLPRPLCSISSSSDQSADSEQRGRLLDYRSDSASEEQPKRKSNRWLADPGPCTGITSLFQQLLNATAAVERTQEHTLTLTQC